jgi:hypothetical protein
MTGTFGGTYDTGTVFTGTLMTTQAEVGDWIYVEPLNVVILVTAVTDDTHLAITPSWTGTTQTNIQYTLLKMSALRYDPALTQAKVRELLSFYDALGMFYFVEGSVPDPSIGIDGQWALKVNSADWLIWYHDGGVWVQQGNPVGIDLQGIWDSGITYATKQTVSWLGAIWQSLQNGNLNKQPDAEPTWWAKIIKGGDRYDVQFYDTDRPGSGELLNKLYPKGVTFYTGLLDSYARAEIASTGTVFFSFQKNDVEFARLTFNAGNPVGVFTCASNTTFNAGDKYTMVAPAVRDDTLSGVGGNIIGYR